MKKIGITAIITMALVMFFTPATALAQNGMKPEDWIFVDSTPPPPQYWCIIPGTMIPYPCSWGN
jgi:hypothetical protein